MDKKNFGIKLGTVLTLFVCLLVAVCIWMIVKYNLSGDAASLLLHSPMRYI